MLIRPEYLKSVEGLTLLARKIVDNTYLGQHQSRRNGSGQEFSQYKNYQPGDDIRLLDWKLYARSDRFFIRESQIETNIEVSFILDASASMLHEEEGIQKIEYARLLIATLAWLAQKQGDQISLYAINEDQTVQLNPKPGKQFFQRFLHELIKVKGQSKFPEALPALQPVIRKGIKKIIIILTDMHQRKDEIFALIKQLNLPFHEILLFQIMGKKELNLDYKGTLTFEDLETGQTKQIDITQVQKTYQAKLNTHIQSIKTQLLLQNVTHQLFKMPEHPGETLKAFLKRRNRLI